MKKLLIWGTVLAGAVGAYLMYRRGAPMGEILKSSVQHPVQTFATEVQNAV